MSDAGGPYRDPAGVPCPVCSTRLLAANPAEPLSCPAGCGGWYPPAALAALIDVADLRGHAKRWWTHQPVACPVCAVTMELVGREQTTLELCASHGLWIAAERWAPFRDTFEGAIMRQAERRAPVVVPVAEVPLTTADQVERLTARVARLERLVAALRRSGTLDD